MLFLSGMAHAQALTLSASGSTMIQVDQNVTFINSTSSGTPPYTYAYSVIDSGNANALGNGEASVAGNTIMFLAANTYAVIETATDSTGATVTSSPVLVTVSTIPPSITLSASGSTAIATGQNVTFANSTTSGTPPYTYAYSVIDSNSADAMAKGEASIAGNQITFAMPGTYQVSETVTDSTGATGTSSEVAITVSAGATPPTITGTPSNYVDPAAAATSAGSTETYTTPTATDQYGTALTPTCTPASGSTFPIGNTAVTCTAADAYGNAASTTFTVTIGPQIATSTVPSTATTTAPTTTVAPAVNATPAVTTPAPNAGDMLPLIGTGVAIAVAVAAGVAYSRIYRRRRTWR